MTAQTIVRQGIVLRSFMPYKHKISVFESSLGRIEGMVSHPSVLEKALHGALVQFRVEEVQNFYRFQDFELIALPAAWVNDDILFLHHVLELTDFFVPLGEFSQELGQLFCLLYAECPLNNVELFKRIFVCRFFLLLGIYPENAEMYEKDFFRLLSGSLDSMLEQAWDRTLLKNLNRWLEGCVQVHPYAHRLKTIAFLQKVDIYEI